ncbi:MAG TPA: hypothetical protein DEQ43_05685 [Nocardioides bacterium]|uniref:DUF6325 family protein n=1 Tax=uncultured Nocardioides sp. TaxID=198441 RepID=UPI000EE02A0A|nr:DUF6325 family protein [uncultured Nocardioides sp.]HCB03730.1 hypothetical protein [Nocardioides sp.]
MLGAERGADRADRPDPDLLEYLLLSAPDVTGLASVATAVVALARSGTIRLVDAVLLVRSEGQTTVRTISPGEHPSLAALGRATTGGVLLSSHDLELMALTLGPDEAALLLLVEDRWAATLSAAVRRSGARMTAGERVPRGRVAASLEAAIPTARHGRADLLHRSPGTTTVFDQVEQVRQLSRLVDRGVLPLDHYEVQRRRVLQG